MMGKFMIFPFFHGDLMFSLAYNNYLDPLDIFTRYQVAIMDFEFSTGENVLFPIETNS